MLTRFSPLLPAFGLAAVCLLTFSGTARCNEFGNAISALPTDLTEVLAHGSRCDEAGAMGRNHPKYFHVRFQSGMHRLAFHAIAKEDPRVLSDFVRALEYSLDHQLPSGAFELVIPDSLRTARRPTKADLASGLAFFLASAGTGLHALETSDWAMASKAIAAQRDRLAATKPALTRSLNRLLANKAVLAEYDSVAPNRLLFDAVAFHTLGTLLDNQNALSASREFVNKAFRLVDAEGYFIEKGGYDSSYNGVATALALRLQLMNALPPHSQVPAKAIAWQVTRIRDDGMILTAGNTRVNEVGGESFLGRKKDVDVAHTVEALLFHSVAADRSESVQRARAVVNHYRNAARTVVPTE
ncbi:MAG: hypothetical protein AAF989_05640 [Planctomycetota bacterium]